MSDLSSMEDKRKPERGLKEVSHLFLSRQKPPPRTKQLIGRSAQAEAGEILPLPDVTARKAEIEKVSAGVVKQNLCLFFSSSSLFTGKSFLACNLAVELARRNLSLGLIETSTQLPNVFFLLGSLFPESTKEESASSFPENVLTEPLMPPGIEPQKLMDISTGDQRNIRAVLLDKNLDSADSFAILNRQRHESDSIIINTSRDIFQFKKMISLVNPFFIVPTTVHSEELLKSYLLIKQISECVACRGVGLLIMQESRYHRAEAAFNVIARMAHKFLAIKVCFMGTIPKGADFSRSILAQTPLLLKVQNSPISQSIKRLADILIKKYSYAKETDNGKGNS